MRIAGTFTSRGELYLNTARLLTMEATSGLQAVCFVFETNMIITQFIICNTYEICRAYLIWVHIDQLQTAFHKKFLNI